MKKKLWYQKEEIWFLVLWCAVLAGVLFSRMANIRGMIIFPDEFGYWSSAAGWNGWDWSQVTGLESFYSYGYAFLLFPLMKLGFGPEALYQAAVVLNLALLLMGMVLLYQILKKISGWEDGRLLAFVSAACCFYVSWIFYMQVALTEILLVFTYLLACRLLLLYLERPSGLKAAVYAAALIYLFMIHMRTLGILAAGVCLMVLLICTDKRYRKSGLVFLVIFSICLLAAFTMKEKVVATTFSGADKAVLGRNDFSGQMAKLRNLFSADQVISFLKSCLGKAFYLGSASFGLYFWGLGEAVNKSLKCLKKRNGEGEAQTGWLYPFILLASVFTFFISAFYMKGGRTDHLIYGRYNEIALPVLMAAGMLSMAEAGRRIWVKTAGICAALAAAAAVLIQITAAYTDETVYECFVAGLSHCMDLYDFHAGAFFRNAGAYGCVSAIAVAALFYVIRKNNRLYWILSLLILFQILLGLRITNSCTIAHNLDNYTDIRLAYEIEDRIGEDGKVWYLESDTDTQYIDGVQFALQERTVHVVRKNARMAEETIQPQDFVVVYKNSPYVEALSGLFNTEKQSSHFLLFYNE